MTGKGIAFNNVKKTLPLRDEEVNTHGPQGMMNGKTSETSGFLGPQNLAERNFDGNF